MSTFQTQWYFTSPNLRLEETNEHNPHPDRKSSDGWGYALADWLRPQLEQLGYCVATFEPDTCGWSLTIPFERFSLQLSCMVLPAGSISNSDALELGGLDLWDLAATANKPQATGGWLRRTFAQADPIDVMACENRLRQLSLDIQTILASEPSVRISAGEPEFED
jgi:hypothetical protein